MVDAKLSKDIQIKTGILRRYVKEYLYYEKDAQKQLDKINSMKEDPSIDPYTLKKANEVLTEGRAMIPIAAANVLKNSNELKYLIETNVDALKDSELVVNAQKELEAAKNIS